MTECKECGQTIYEPPPPIDIINMSDDALGELHAKQRHPNFDYVTVETGRKTGEYDYPNDEGLGWVLNPFKRWQRFDYTEEAYWLRLKVLDNNNVDDEYDYYEDKAALLRGQREAVLEASK